MCFAYLPCPTLFQCRNRRSAISTLPQIIVNAVYARGYKEKEVGEVVSFHVFSSLGILSPGRFFPSPSVAHRQ